MAGCQPEYAPVGRAAMLALTDPPLNLNGVQATTHMASPLNDRRAADVGDVQGAALVRHLDPFRRQALFEMRLRLLQVLLGEHPHADPLGLRLGALEHQAVTTGLGDATQVDGVVALVADDEADQVDVKARLLATSFTVGGTAWLARVRLKGRS